MNVISLAIVLCVCLYIGSHNFEKLSSERPRSETAATEEEGTVCPSGEEGEMTVHGALRSGRDVGTNVLGGVLQQCSRSGSGPTTGFFRDGCCSTGPHDLGRHVVCSKMTVEFLNFTRARGNDLSSPAPEYGFPGLKPDDMWCLCASRWKEAFEAGVAPPVVLESTHRNALSVVSLEDLRTHALTQG